MTPEEQTILSQLIKKVDGMSNVMVTKDLLHAEISLISNALENHLIYSKAASEAESNRLNAIHDSDAKALSVANAEANEKAATLAANVDKVSTTSRDLVEATRVAYSKSQADLINPIIEKIQLIEKKQYEDQGKQFYSDPMLKALVERMEGVATAISESKGKAAVSDPALITLTEQVKALLKSDTLRVGSGAGSKEMWGYVSGAIVLAGVIIGIIVRFL